MPKGREIGRGDTKSGRDSPIGVSSDVYIYVIWLSSSYVHIFWFWTQTQNITMLTRLLQIVSFEFVNVYMLWFSPKI